MSTEIKFGTDGWRSVISDGFTFQNVKRVTQAACDVAKKESRSRLIVVGYDRRFFSRRFAETAARVARGNGFKVEISNEPLGSPALSFTAKHRKSALGIMITASHNPPQFNGFKLKSPNGGSVDGEFTRKVEARLDESPVLEGKDGGQKKEFNSAYVSFVKNFVTRNSFGQIKAPVVFDAMHGPSAVPFGKCAESLKKLILIREENDPLFGGVDPEPIEKNLGVLKEAVVRNKAAIGLAVDGDLDRLGVVDDHGHYLPPHTVMPLLLLHLIENRKLKGKIVQATSMGYLTERIARHFNYPFEEVPVGFKHIAEKMHQEKILLGGEESGGYGVGLWFPERDGLLWCLVLLEMLAKSKISLSEMVVDMEKRFGQSYFKRVDYKLNRHIEKQEWGVFIQKNMGKTFAGFPIKEVKDFDGIKIILESGAWVLMRPSGTEPLIRTYSEAPSQKVVKDLLAEAERLVLLVPAPSKRRSAGRKDNKKNRSSRSKVPV